MPDTVAKATTNPRRTAARKPAPAKAAPKPAETADDSTESRVAFPLEHFGTTKSYEVFAPAKDTGCVGKFYAPLGTTDVRVLLVGPAAVIEG
jgi:hypothetical protein